MNRKLLLNLFLILTQIGYGDVIPEASHSVQKCVKIINASDFPDISIVGYEVYPTGEDIETYIIKSNSCLESGYKFNSLYILAVKKSYLINKNLDSIDWLNNKNVLKSNIDIYCDGGYLSNANPISAIEEFYKIVGFTDTSFILYKCKELFRFSDGRPISVKTYSNSIESAKFGNKSIDTHNSKNGFSIFEIYSESDLIKFINALLTTILVETLVLLLVFKTKYKALNVKTTSLLFTGILCSFSTLPFVWFVLPIIIKSSYSYIFISEILVIIIESLIIFQVLKINYKKAILVSIICNLSSFLVGIIINWIKFFTTNRLK